MNAPSLPDWIVEPQRIAANPDLSAWVSANAGSGKTHVLTQRVIGLLLGGCDPAKILCITFTKAAAANMSERVFGTLAEWTTLDDAALDRRISDLGSEPTPATRARARRLFALTVETPGGLKVQTIHAFCTRLLHHFPFEADVSARFDVLDDATESQILEDISLGAILEGIGDPSSALGRAIECATTHAGDQTLREMIGEAIAGRDTIHAWIEGTGSLDAAMTGLSGALGLAPGDTVATINEQFFSHSLISSTEWPVLSAALSEGAKTDKDQAERFRMLAELSGNAASDKERLETLLSIYCTKDRSPRKSLHTKSIREAHPTLADLLLAEQERICALLDKLNAATCHDKTKALLTIASTVIGRYRAEKDRRGLLDYDDLIDRTLTLFRRTSALWVLYKLDLGIDHVLIDEAQDTSPKQWEIIRTLVADFTAGASARQVKRTMFAVGDDKQSIFSFQGADPVKFDQTAKEFEKSFKEAGLTWEGVQLRASFRSGPAILEAVDAVFKLPASHRGFSSDPTGTVHIALPDAAPGCVEIWPLVLREARQKPEGWDAPFDKLSESSPQVRLAARIAAHAALWQAKGTSPRDILILVRQRGALFEAIIRALKANNIPVAGADRLVLTDHIAVMDLMVLADALLLPEDDLALATVLKSPLFGFDDDALFELAWKREQRSLRETLAANGQHKDIAAQLDDLAQLARAERPLAFYSRLLGPMGGRRKFLQRLGAEANDALDEFLNLALDYERREAPTLQGFVAWLRRAQTEIKRDMELLRDEVRVMTVHGAKGLEAPIVILADTTTRPEGSHPPRLVKMPVGPHEGLIWSNSKDANPAPVSAARDLAIQATQDEYRRLMYVAMTRARERLVVCGMAGRVKEDGTPSISEECWYRLIEYGLQDATEEIAAEDGDGTIRRFLKSAPPVSSPSRTLQEQTKVEPPAWLHEIVAGEPIRMQTIRPSDENWDAHIPAPDAANREQARMRGILIHRLMQSLPDIAADHRAQAARSYLAREGSAFTEAEREEIAAQVDVILNDPRFAPLFAQGSRAEVPIVGRLPRGGQGFYAVSGQVDRLVVTEQKVLIADYKTNRPAPGSLDEAERLHPGYIRQLALYRAVLSEVYPDHDIQTALIWTDKPDLMIVPATTLDRALKLTSV